MSQKKDAVRNVTVALGIVCLILSVGLVGVFAYYMPMISDKNNTISSLNSKISELTNSLNLNISVIWADHQTINQPANSYSNWWNPYFSAPYAGYISVAIHTSTTDKTYVRVIYSSHSVDYDNQIDVGTSGIAFFPVLPNASIDIRVGNTDFFNGATETVTISYYY